MKLSLLTILLGVGMGLPQVYGLVQPARLASAARKFPRNLPAGIFLMLLGTAWFLWIVNREPIADFSVFKPYMMTAFAAVGVGSCIFVQDFLAVRGLAVVALLLGKLMVDTGSPHLGRIAVGSADPSVGLCIDRRRNLVYRHALEIARLFEWATATEARVKVGSAIRLAFAIFIVALGLTAFRAM